MKVKIVKRLNDALGPVRNPRGLLNGVTESNAFVGILDGSPEDHWMKIINQKIADLDRPEAKEIQFILEQLKDISTNHWAYPFILYAASVIPQKSPHEWESPYLLPAICQRLEAILSDAKVLEQEEKDRPVGEKSEKIRLEGEYRHPLRTPIAQIVVGDKVSSKL